MNLNIFETFAGIGAQRRALEELYPGKINSIGVCEWNVVALIAYFSIHERTLIKNKALLVGGGQNT